MKLDGRMVSNKILDDIKNEVSMLKIKPKLAIIYIGNDESSDIYIKNKIKACDKVGILHQLYHLDNPSMDEVSILIDKLNNDSSVSGIIIESPIPSNLNYNYLFNLINSSKDVDGFTKDNVYNNYLGEDSIIPCTVMGIMKLLKYYNIDVDGANVVIVGRSNIVGKPLINTMLNHNATVTICHSHTKGLKNITNKADILISAIGRANYIDKDFVKKGAVVIDVGISRNGNYVCGDVNYDDVKDKVSYITPVPGGVGPMTIAMLMKNVMDVSKRG